MSVASADITDVVGIVQTWIIGAAVFLQL